MKKITFTHYWVTGFGWENTIYLPEDFETVEQFGHSEKEGFVFIAVSGRGISHILKGFYKS